MTWNYRIIKKHDDIANEDIYFLIECYYKEDGSLMGYHDDVGLLGNDTEEIVRVLDMMKNDILKNRPILTEEDFKNGKNIK